MSGESAEGLAELVHLREENEDLIKRIEKIEKEKDVLHKRVIEIENAFETEQSIKIRQDITIVKADFTKVEMAFLFAGVNLLLKNSKNAEDTRFYLALYDKVQKLLDNMKEEEPESNDSK